MDRLWHRMTAASGVSQAQAVSTALPSDLYSIKEEDEEEIISVRPAAAQTRDTHALRRADGQAQVQPSQQLASRAQLISSVPRAHVVNRLSGACMPRDNQSTIYSSNCDAAVNAFDKCCKSHPAGHSRNVCFNPQRCAAGLGRVGQV